MEITHFIAYERLIAARITDTRLYLAEIYLNKML